MDFSLSEEQILIQNMVRSFAEEEIRPIAAEIDRTHRFPMENIKRMGELGLFGLFSPEIYGGAGGDYLSYILAIEEVAKACASHATIFSVHTSVGLGAILSFGTEAQKAKYLPDLISGAKIGAFALTEPGAGTDAAAQKTVAVRKGDTYILNGSKIFITNGGFADTVVVAAMTNPSLGLKGISTFIVEKDFPGFEVGQTEEKMGICASSTTELLFKNCEVPAENLLGQEGKGFSIAMQALDGGRVGIAALATGIAQASLDAAVAYAKERVQFGKPIAANQGIQWMLAEMEAEVDHARLATYRAALAKQAGGRYSREAAIAKLVASEAAMNVSTRAVQILGGIGYTKSYPVERYMRDAKITQIYEGTSEVQKMVISAALLA